MTVDMDATRKLVAELRGRLAAQGDPISLVDAQWILYDRHEVSVMLAEQTADWKQEGFLLADNRLHALDQEIERGLAEGWIGSTGIVEPVSLKSKREPIPAHFWNDLEIAYHLDEAVFGGLRILKIEIEIERQKNGQSTARQPISRGAIERWYRDHAELLKQQDRKSSFADDQIAAREYFGQSISRVILRAERRKYPDIHRPLGRPPKT